ncbi:LPS assembly protein LptD [Burkholderiaceae bacterium DAT-1]|nr:LPS assembly protein LptD [Burkholderiaceae bacterium DAT-1]
MSAFRLHPLALACAALSLAALADTATTGPTTIEAAKLDGEVNENLLATGDVVLKRDGKMLEAPWVRILKGGRELQAGDTTRFSDRGSVINGKAFELKEGSEAAPRSGYIDAPAFSLGNARGHGDAVKLLFVGEDQYTLDRARFTTCAPGNEAWYAHSETLDLDYSRNLGKMYWGKIEIGGVPVTPTLPYLDFSLDGSRKSGLLSPVMRGSGADGLDIAFPWYWNIAPNFDDTITPRLILKRGIMLENEFRYLTPRSRGEFRYSRIGHDRVTGEQRNFGDWQHTQILGDGWSAGLNLQRVSDDGYFADFGDRLAVASQAILPRQANLAYWKDGLQLNVRTSHFQTLQDPQRAVLAPYAQLPQITLNYTTDTLSPLRLDVFSELDDFSHPTQINGKRAVVYPSISMPMATSWGFLTPKIGFNSTRYRLSDFQTTVNQTVQRQPGYTLSRDLPIASLDAGLYFDRDFTWSGLNMLQSLEPRLYYVRIPYRDQSAFPNFDSSVADFSFAQMFTENQFFGWDRINNANELTAALTSHLIDADTGIEALRFAVGQRFYFQPQKVYITQQTTGTNETSSDLMTAISGNFSREWSADVMWEYNRQDRKTQKAGLFMHYQPGLARMLNLGYQYDRVNNIHQASVSTQWPIAGRWHGVASQTWSFVDHRSLETLVGAEYNGGCWALRVGMQRFVTPTQQPPTPRFMLQIELNNFGSIQTNQVFETLKQSIPGYSKTNQTTELQ